MPIRLRCPDCKAKLSVATRKSGQTIKCPGCKAEIVVPVVESKKQEPAAETPAEKPAEKPKAKEKQRPAAVGAPAPAVDLPTYDQLWGDDEPEDDDEDGLTLSSKGDQVEEMDLTPMVDVTFLLLIFFMITASFSIQKTLEVPAPDPDEEGASTSISIQEMEETSVTVHIDSRNVMYVDDEPVSDPTRLPDMLRASRMSEVLITSHEDALHEMVVKAIDAANEVQMQKIRLGVTRGAE